MRRDDEDPRPPTRSQLVAQNRERLLTAAEELFADSSRRVTLNDIARHAGLGVGTAYRRFANKEEVIAALFERRLERAVALAHECLDEPDAGRGLVRYLELSLKLEAAGHGMSELIARCRVPPDQQMIDEWRDRLAPLLDELVTRAKDQGFLRTDIETGDVIVLRAGLTAIVDMTRPVRTDVFRRYLAIVLDGMRARPSSPTPLPVPGPAIAEAHSAMAAVRWSPASWS